jgi:hypothetical protein
VVDVVAEEEEEEEEAVCEYRIFLKNRRKGGGARECALLVGAVRACGACVRACVRARCQQCVHGYQVCSFARSLRACVRTAVRRRQRKSDRERRGVNGARIHVRSERSVGSFARIVRAKRLRRRPHLLLLAPCCSFSGRLGCIPRGADDI